LRGVIKKISLLKGLFENQNFMLGIIKSLLTSIKKISKICSGSLCYKIALLIFERWCIVIGIIITIGLGVVLALVLVIWLIGERWKLLRRSTWNSIKAGGLFNFFTLKTLHMYIYLRWSKLYVKTVIHHILPKFAPLLTEKMKKRLVDTYHSKVLTQELAQAVITINRDIPLHDLEQIIPYSMARNLVLNGPLDIAVHECSCRHTRQGPCQPTQVCMIVGRPFVEFVLEHHPGGSRRLTQEEAMDILRAEHERGHIHTAWFKDVCLDRFFVICNCCKCCCGGIEAMVKYGLPTLAPSGYIVEVDEKRCETCGICEEVCPFGAIYVDEKTTFVDWHKCMGCGVCAGQCPNEAISLARDDRKGIPLDVRMLAED
jgi:NAD-dependent dihydropyrimidine dehydrogenase PreA subunit